MTQDKQDNIEISHDPIVLTRLSVPNVIAMTARLAQVLAEEADFLEQMKIQDVRKLQQEKMQLTKALEIQKKVIEETPEALDDISSEEREELRAVVNIFDEILEENHRRLLIAKQVNETVVDAIKDVVKKKSSKTTYNGKGDADRAQDSVSVTLNETI